MSGSPTAGQADLATAPVKLLYVGGMPRSGSTLTDLMLDSLPGHVAVGELFYLWRNGLVHDGLCACGQRFSGCPFWHAVGEQAFGGWRREDGERVLRLQAEVDRTACVPLVLAGRPSGFARALQDYRDVLQRLYSAIADVSGARVVVDSSKRGSLAFVLRSMPGIDLTVAHVVRDPRGVAHSFSKRVPLPAGVDLAEEMPRTPPRKVARRWLTVNALVGSLQPLGVPLVRVRYEDLVNNPLRELRRIAAAEGEPALERLDALDDRGLQVPDTHVVAGGRIRLAEGVLPLRLDDAWRREIDPAARRLVSGLTWPLRAAYGYA